MCLGVAENVGYGVGQCVDGGLLSHQRVRLRKIMDAFVLTEVWLDLWVLGCVWENMSVGMEMCVGDWLGEWRVGSRGEMLV